MLCTWLMSTLRRIQSMGVWSIYHQMPTFLVLQINRTAKTHMQSTKSIYINKIIVKIWSQKPNPSSEGKKGWHLKVVLWQRRKQLSKLTCSTWEGGKGWSPLPDGGHGQPSIPTLGKSRDLISTGSTLSNSFDLLPVKFQLLLTRHGLSFMWHLPIVCWSYG